jgi:hypothetical protein
LPLLGFLLSSRDLIEDLATITPPSLSGSSHTAETPYVPAVAISNQWEDNSVTVHAPQPVIPPPIAWQYQLDGNAGNVDFDIPEDTIMGWTIPDPESMSSVFGADDQFAFGQVGLDNVASNTVPGLNEDFFSAWLDAPNGLK